VTDEPQHDPREEYGASAWETPGLALADRFFRLGAKVTLGLLLLTAGLYAFDFDHWRAAFTAAHLAALVALLPLGVALTRHGLRRTREAGDPGVLGLLRRYRVVMLLLAVVLVAVVVSLVNFEDGSRVVRRIANFTTVGIVLALVVRYLRWSARQRQRPTLGEGRLF
jgi:di/tricarboxylate transporter